MKNVLITGASRGIGNAIAIEFAKQGHALVLVSKSSIQLLETLKEHLNGCVTVGLSGYLD